MSAWKDGYGNDDVVTLRDVVTSAKPTDMAELNMVLANAYGVSVKEVETRLHEFAVYVMIHGDKPVTFLPEWEQLTNKEFFTDPYEKLIMLIGYNEDRKAVSYASADYGVTWGDPIPFEYGDDA